MLYDSQLDEFLSRFGSKDPMSNNSGMVTLPQEVRDGRKSQPTAFTKELLKDGIEPQKDQNKFNELTNGFFDVKNNPELTQGKGLLKTKKMGLGDYGDIATMGLDLVHDLKGNKFDTSAHGGGPGKPTGHILGGAAKGFQAGMATGNPFIAGGAALVGAIAPLVGHKKAMEEWRSNQKKQNKKLNALEKAELDEQYAMAEGMASLGNLQALRKKQLGMLS